MAKYRCKVSGTIIELTAPADVESMKTHDGYEMVEEEKKPTLSLPKEEKQTKGK